MGTLLILICILYELIIKILTFISYKPIINIDHILYGPVIKILTFISYGLIINIDYILYWLVIKILLYKSILAINLKLG